MRYLYKSLIIFVIAILPCLGGVAIADTWVYAEDGNPQAFWQSLTGTFKWGRYSGRPEVKKAETWFLAHPAVIEQMLNHSAPYIYYVSQEVHMRSIPGEFTLLPFVESGYNPNALSKVGALGLWQILPSAASDYGLEDNWWFDGRKDIVFSTQMALDDLLHLHDRFHSWLLALAAYHDGGERIARAVKYNKAHNEATDFWSLPISPHTKAYVGQVIALAAMFSNPSQYHLTLPAVPNHPYFRGVILNEQLSLYEIAQFSGQDITLVRTLNPGWLRWATMPGQSYTIYLPIDAVDSFLAHWRAVQGVPHTVWGELVVRGSESLDQIAKEYHTTVELLKKVNKLKHHYLRPGQGILVPIGKVPIGLNQAGAVIRSPGDVPEATKDPLKDVVEGMSGGS